MKSYFRYIYKVMSPACMAALIVLSLMVGCKEKVDPILSEIDSKMEEHPDSALMLLDSYHLSDNASDQDRAYYGMLLTHARYKNFIDETNDSLISASAEYFLKHHCKEQASRSLFLQGMIQMNGNHLGDAAVSFSKGLDIAKEGKQYMWEGQCARGLCMLYGELNNGSAQIEYAKKAYEAFVSTGDKSRISYAKWEMAIAYNNNWQFDNALSLLDELEKKEEFDNDALWHSQILQLKAQSLFFSKKYKESLENYIKSYEINPAILSIKDKSNIRYILSELFGDYIPENIKWLESKVRVEDASQEVFVVLERQERYKEAYESLMRYKNCQDSVLSVMYSNNVSELINQYETIKMVMKEGKAKNERMTYWIVILTVIIIGVFVYGKSRERMQKEHLKRLSAEAAMESIKSDLLLQLQGTGVVSSENDIDSNSSKDFYKIIRQRYAEANALCDDYYQRRFSKNAKDDIKEEINKLVKTFTERSNLEKIGKYVDDNSNRIYSDFLYDFFDLNEDNRKLFLYFVLGFSSRTISVIFDQDISAIYNKKSRLKSRIVKSNCARKEEYLSFF